MEITNLQVRATACHITGQPFEEGQPVLSMLLNDEASGEVVRVDMLESVREQFSTNHPVICSWVQPYKPRSSVENPERELKMTAEELFLTLAAPANGLSPENIGLVQFLALVLERKRILRLKGTTPDRRSYVYEHAKTKQFYEVPIRELTPEFFLSIQEQMNLLFGKNAETPRPSPEKGNTAPADTETGGSGRPASLS